MDFTALPNDREIAELLSLLAGTPTMASPRRPRQARSSPARGRHQQDFRQSPGRALLASGARLRVASASAGAPRHSS